MASWGAAAWAATLCATLLGSSRGVAAAPSWPAPLPNKLPLDPLPHLPEPVRLRDCRPTSSGLQVRWLESEAADLYEVQLASSPEGPAFFVLTHRGSEVHLREMLPNTTYWVRVRGHASDAPSLGPGSWGNVGPALQCRTLDTLNEEVDPVDSDMVQDHGKTFHLEMMRQSEYCYEVDYLANHNSGDILGDAAWSTFSLQHQNHTLFNVSFNISTFALYCVEILRVHIPDSTTAVGDDRFANYTSCNNGDDPLRSQCQCDIWYDRKIANQNPDTECHNSTGGPCDGFHIFDDCNCTCTSRSLSLSSRYVGMMPVYQHSPVQVGEWYSMPKDGECLEGDRVGVPRKDGSFCTWRRRPDARVVKGYQVLEHGFNASSSPGFADLDPKQVHQNLEVFRRTFASAPLKPWRCGRQESGWGQADSPLVI